MIMSMPPPATARRQYLPAECARCHLRFALTCAAATTALAGDPIACPYCRHSIRLLPRDRSRVAAFLGVQH